jgi:hypothetical protein
LPENPLLPNRKLQELHALMLRARFMSQAPAASPQFEALLAATLMHVEAGDFVSSPPGVKRLILLASERTYAPLRKKKAAPAGPETPMPATQRLAAVAGLARGFKLAKSDRIAVAYLDAGTASARTEPGWAESLAYIQKADVPLVTIVADATGGARVPNPKAISWPTISKLTAKLQLPILTVDGEDAVAIYRAMQESSLRARMVGSPSVIYAVLTPGSQVTSLKRSQRPVARLESYLKTRNIPFPR